MLWQYLITALSLLIFAWWVVFNVCKFGLLDCYSAYGPIWIDRSKWHNFNWWPFITVATAAMLLPVLLQCGDGSVWQFTGFLVPVCMAAVGFFSDCRENKTDRLIHCVAAELAALWAVLYMIFAAHLWWVVVAYVLLAAILSLITGWKRHWNFWFEMAAYAGIYTSLFLII